MELKDLPRIQPGRNNSPCDYLLTDIVHLVQIKFGSMSQLARKFPPVAVERQQRVTVAEADIWFEDAKEQYALRRKKIQMEVEWELRGLDMKSPIVSHQL